MKCAHARKLLYPNPERAEVTIEHSEALAHLRSCDDCQRLFEARASWVGELKSQLSPLAAPRHLRQAVNEITQPRRAGLLSRRAMHVAAAAVLIIAIAVGWLASRANSQGFFRSICEDHAKYLTAESQLQSTDPSQIETWFREKTDFGVRVPALETTNLLGARLCFLQDRKAALVFYQKSGRPVSMFQLSAKDVSLAGLDRSVIDGSPFWRMSYKGYALAAFEQRGVVFVLVSDLRETDLLQMASMARIRSAGF